MADNGVRLKSEANVDSIANMFEARNTKMLHVVADNLGATRSKVVFLGGTILPLLLTRPEAQIVRPSKDVDLIFHANSRTETYNFEDDLWDRGFVKTQNGVVCCWKIDGVRIDILPSTRNIVRFKNRWCNEACDKPINHHFGKGKAIRVISAPVFIGTKFEAFSRRGRNNYLSSFDIADIFLVLGGRPELKADIDKYASDELKSFLAEEFIKLQKIVKNTDVLLPESLLPYSTEVDECIASIVAFKKITKESKSA